ncbi:hypothetical protein E8E11_002679 [Didymella keratinophila]|nr:hypothetical protein E8E11_002679 [Didymella keratinophila]
MPDATTTREEIFAKSWVKTDYVVVAEIAETGQLGSVWLLWKLWKAKEPNAPGDVAAAGDAESKNGDPHPLKVYQEQVQNVDFKNVNQVAVS